MIRPCDMCGGKGKVPAPAYEQRAGLYTLTCLRCEKMPKLQCRHHSTNPHRRLVNGGIQDQYAKPIYEDCPGWFYPDPDSEGLAQWCETHNASWWTIGVGQQSGCVSAVALMMRHAKPVYGCVKSWVLATPLEEAT